MNIKGRIIHVYVDRLFLSIGVVNNDRIERCNSKAFKHTCVLDRRSEKDLRNRADLSKLNMIIDDDSSKIVDADLNSFGIFYLNIFFGIDNKSDIVNVLKVLNDWVDVGINLDEAYELMELLK